MKFLFLLLLFVAIQNFEGVFFYDYENPEDCSFKRQSKSFYYSQRCIHVTDEEYQFFDVHEKSVVQHFGCSDEECNKCSGKREYPFDTCHLNHTVSAGNLEKTDEEWLTYVFAGDTECNEKENIIRVIVTTPACLVDPGYQTSNKVFCEKGKVLEHYYQGGYCMGSPTTEPYSMICEKSERGYIQNSCKIFF